MSQTTQSFTAEILAIARTIDTVLLESGDLHTVVLYGSAARGALRGENEMASDVDVAVAGDETLPIDRRLELASRLAARARSVGTSISSISASRTASSARRS